MEGSEFEEKINILKIALASELEHRLLSLDDLEVISLGLEKHKFASKTLIFREKDVYDKLILIGKGKLQIINEFILS